MWSHDRTTVSCQPVYGSHLDGQGVSQHESSKEISGDVTATHVSCASLSDAIVGPGYPLRDRGLEQRPSHSSRENAAKDIHPLYDVLNHRSISPIPAASHLHSDSNTSMICTRSHSGARQPCGLRRRACRRLSCTSSRRRGGRRLGLSSRADMLGTGRRSTKNVCARKLGNEDNAPERNKDQMGSEARRSAPLDRRERDRRRTPHLVGSGEPSEQTAMMPQRTQRWAFFEKLSGECRAYLRPMSISHTS